MTLFYPHDSNIKGPSDVCSFLLLWSVTWSDEECRANPTPIQDLKKVSVLKPKFGSPNLVPGHPGHPCWLWSMDWFKGKFTGNHSFYHSIWGFPVNFPLNQSIDLRAFPWLFHGFSSSQADFFFPHLSTERPKVWMENCRAAVLRRLGKLGNVSILENARGLAMEKKKRGHSDHDIPWPMTLWGFVKTQTPDLPKNRSESCWECWDFWIFMDGLHHFIWLKMVFLWVLIQNHVIVAHLLMTPWHHGVLQVAKWLTLGCPYQLSAYTSWYHIVSDHGIKRRISQFTNSSTSSDSKFHPCSSIFQKIPSGELT